MNPRYFLMAGDGEAGLVEQLARRTGLRPAYAEGGVSALVNPACQCIPLPGHGFILGTLFPRHGPARALSTLSEPEARRIAQSSGGSLIADYWGGYVAVIGGANRARLLRDPSGLSPCYYATRKDGIVAASDADLLVRSGFIGVSIDAAQIGHQLYRAFVPRPETALRGISELLAGFAFTLPDPADRQAPCWSPWDHVAASPADRPPAPDELARTIVHCVQSWASTQQAVLLSVSGGLDSSIVAACLARGSTTTHCLTMFTDDPGGDERPFARTLCEYLGLPLIERPYRFADIDLSDPLGANQPRPRDRIQAIAYERVHEAAADELGIGVFMTGNGGDHVFGYSQTAAPIVDRYLSTGASRAVLTTLLDICRQTGCSMVDALGQAWRLRRAHRPQIRPNPLFLEPLFVEALSATPVRHPWLDAPGDALPGKAAHVAAILRAQPLLEPGHGTAYALLNPLMSQPVIEACLAIPSWAWRAGGHDRAAVRDAFAKDLPDPIVKRRGKGSPSRFAAALLDHFRSVIRERLLGGRLAAERIIDAAAVEQALAGEGPIGDIERVRLFELVSSEAWMTKWTASDRYAPAG